VNLALVPTAVRARPAALITAAGVSGFATVAAAGFSAGFFAWYAYLTRSHHGAFALEITFLAAIVLGPVAALWLWDAYASSFARRNDIPYASALRWDVPSWAMLCLLWLAFTGASGFSSTGRATALAAAAFALVKLLVEARFDEPIRDVLFTFALTRIPILIIAELASTIIGQRAGVHFTASHIPLLAVWGRWDAEHYLGIAINGYSGTEPAFFPLYPFLIRILGATIGNTLIAGLAVSNLASFFALLYLYKLVAHEYNRQVAHRAIFYVSIFPTAIFFSAVYTESLFLCLTVASFYYLRERRWVTAGVFGYFAALTRVEGVLLAIPLLIEAALALRAQRLDWWKWPADTILKPLVGLCLVPLGLATYMAYLWVLRGDPLYFSHVQEHWGRHFAPPWVSIQHSFHLLTSNASPQTIANQALEVTFTAFMLTVLVIGFRRLRASYIAYMALSILVPMSTGSLMSMPRFALVLFPIFALFGLWGAKPNVHNAIVAFSLPLLGLFTVLFADWYWVA
jgi:hypothetical protein